MRRRSGNQTFIQIGLKAPNFEFGASKWLMTSIAAIKRESHYTEKNIKIIQLLHRFIHKLLRNLCRLMIRPKPYEYFHIFYHIFLVHPSSRFIAAMLVISELLAPNSKLGAFNPIWMNVWLPILHLIFSLFCKIFLWQTSPCPGKSFFSRPRPVSAIGGIYASEPEI